MTEREPTTEPLDAELMRLQAYAVFEQTMLESDERLITREDALARLSMMAPYFNGEAA